MFSNSNSSSNGVFGFKWTNNNQQCEEFYKTSENNKNLYQCYNDTVTSFSTAGSHSHKTFSFIENINCNDLIFVPYFIIRQVKLSSKNEDGLYTSATSVSTIATYTLAEFKPADKTPAGQYYDSDLWDNGIKLIDSDSDSVTYQWVAGVVLKPMYGKTSKIYDNVNDSYSEDITSQHTYGARGFYINALAQNTGDFPTGYQRSYMCCCVETYIPESDAVFYHGIPGVAFCGSTIGGLNEQFAGIRGRYRPNATGEALTYSNYTPCQLYYAQPTDGGISSSFDLNADTVVLFPGFKCDAYNSNDYTGTGTPTCYRDLTTNGSNIFNYFIPVGNRADYYPALQPFYSGADLFSTLATLGFYYADSVNHAEYAPLGTKINGNNHIYLGDMTEAGMASGVMLQGSEIETSVQASIDDLITGTPFTPVNPTPAPPSGSGIDDTEKGTGNYLPNLGLKYIATSAFMHYYLLGISNIADLTAALTTVPATFWQAIGTATDYRTSNLLQYISSLKWYPLDIIAGNPGLFLDTTTTDLQFGFDSNCKLTLLSSFYNLSTAVRVYNMGSVSVPYKLDNETFLDKDPYTTVQIYLPFCGMYPVKSDYVCGETITFYYIVDLTTGMTTAIVTNSRQTLLQATGKIGVDFTVTGNDIITQSEKMSTAYINAGVSAISGGVSLATNAIGGNIAGAVTSSAGLLSNIAKSSIDIASAKRAVPNVVSAGSGFGTSYSPDTPCVIVNPPAVKIPEDYGHTQGYVYNQTAKIGNLSGFAICDNPDLSGIPAEKSEIDMIYQILTTGFYV